MIKIKLNIHNQKRIGKLQFNIIRQEVLSLLAQGYSRRTVYAGLADQGLFTLSYRRFCELVKKTGASEDILSKEASKAVPSLSAKIEPLTIEAERPSQEQTSDQQPTSARSTGFQHSAPDLNNLA